MGSEDESKQSRFSGSESNFAVALRISTQTAQPFLEKEATTTRITVVIFPEREIIATCITAVLFPEIEDGGQSIISTNDQHHKLIV